MIGLGTIVNCGTVAFGTTLGLLLKGGLPQRFEKTILSALALCSFFIGLGGALSQILVVGSDGVSTQYTLLIVLCMAVGAIIGEALDIERRLEGIGEWFKGRIPSNGSGTSTFVEAFVTASLLFCVGAMAIVGAIQDGLLGEYSLLVTKAVLDFIIVLIMTCSLGKGCMFSAIPVAVCQGSVTALAGLLKPVMTQTALANLSLVGSILIFCVGLNLVWDKRIRVANLLPAVAIAVIVAFLPFDI